METKLITSSEFKKIGIDKLYGVLIDIIVGYLESINGILVRQWEYERGDIRNWIISDRKDNIYTVSCKGQLNKFSFNNKKMGEYITYLDVPKYHYGVAGSEEELYVIMYEGYGNVLKSYSVIDLESRLKIELEQDIRYGNTVLQYQNGEIYLVVNECDNIYVYSAKNGELLRKIRQIQIRGMEPIMCVDRDKLYYVTKTYNEINVVNHITGEFVREYKNSGIKGINSIIVNKNDIIMEGDDGIYLCDKGSGEIYNQIKGGGGLNSLAICDGKLIVRECVNEDIGRIKVYE